MGDSIGAALVAALIVVALSVAECCALCLFRLLVSLCLSLAHCAFYLILIKRTLHSMQLQTWQETLNCDSLARLRCLLSVYICIRNEGNCKWKLQKTRSKKQNWATRLHFDYVWLLKCIRCLCPRLELVPRSSSTLIAGTRQGNSQYGSIGPAILSVWIIVIKEQIRRIAYPKRANISSKLNFNLIKGSRTCCTRMKAT